MASAAIVELVIAAAGLILTTVAATAHVEALEISGIVLTAVSLGCLLNTVLSGRDRS